MPSRRPQFSNPRRLLCDDDRLSALRSRVDGIAADLATLEGQTEAEREANQSLRDSVLEQFGRLSEV